METTYDIELVNTPSGDYITELRHTTSIHVPYTADHGIGKISIQHSPVRKTIAT